MGHDPAGYLYRQAHTRFEDPNAKYIADQGIYYEWNEQISLKVERVLRKYGITSEGAGRAEGVGSRVVRVVSIFKEPKRWLA